MTTLSPKKTSFSKIFKLTLIISIFYSCLYFTSNFILAQEATGGNNVYEIEVSEKLTASMNLPPSVIINL